MDAINLASDKNKCCGCGACSNICPKEAITMIEDEYGFVYPKIDDSKCIKCGLCIKTCAYSKDISDNIIKDSYMAVCTDNEILLNSASGGIFSSIAIDIIKNNGVVFGCSMEKDEQGNLEPQHIKVNDLENLKKLQGSKYVQSNTKNVYKEVEKELKNNKLVLFSGTPCQVHALKSFLKNTNQDNLYTIDIICHGVPNAKMFKDYIKYIEKKNKIKIRNFSFRDKSKGNGYFSKIIYISQNCTKKKIIPSIKLSYFQMFLDSINIRKNCYSCPYAGNRRVGEITIGDFWGIEEEHPEYLKEKNINSQNGVSCIIVNNAKGKILINKYSNILLKLDSSFDKIKKHNNQLNNPCTYTNKREELMNLYKDNAYSKVEKWYKKNKGLNYYIKIIWYKIPYKIRKSLKK